MDAKTPSAWLTHLCPDWAKENQQIVGSIDERFLSFKPYLRGKITSQLLCRLSCTSFKKTADGGAFDFWLKMGVDDDFDRAYITSSIERFCATYQVLYESRAAAKEELFISNIKGALTPNQFVQDQALIDAANLVANLPKASMESMQPLPVGKAVARPQKRQKCAPKSKVRMKEPEAGAARKAQEKAAKLAFREERRQKKIEMRKQREDFANQQKMAAFKRAADLVNSNSYPLEICSGAYSQINDPGASDYELNQQVPPPRKNRSQIIISTASDLDQIVQHSTNLWHKYNAIARSHGKQRVNWNVVAKELGIGVKVREKYARMHARALGRGFDFANWGHYRIKDFPQYFLDPINHVSTSLAGHVDLQNPPVLGQNPLPPLDLNDQPQPVLMNEVEAESAVGGGSLQSANLAVVAAAASVQPLDIESDAQDMEVPNESNANDQPQPVLMNAVEAAKAVGGSLPMQCANLAVVVAAASAQPLDVPANEDLEGCPSLVFHSEDSK